MIDIISVDPLAILVCSSGGSSCSTISVRDDSKFDVLASYTTLTGELANAIISTKFEGDEAEYFVVGTAFIRPGVSAKGGGVKAFSLTPTLICGGA